MFFFCLTAMTLLVLFKGVIIYLLLYYYQDLVEVRSLQTIFYKIEIKEF